MPNPVYLSAVVGSTHVSKFIKILEQTNKPGPTRGLCDKFAAANTAAAVVTPVAAAVMADIPDVIKTLTNAAKLRAQPVKLAEAFKREDIQRVQNVARAILNQQIEYIGTGKESVIDHSWLEGLTRVKSDLRPSDFLTSLVRRSRQHFDLWLAAVAALVNAKPDFFDLDPVTDFFTNLSLDDNTHLSDPHFLAVLVSDRTAFLDLCKAIGEEDTNKLKRAIKDAKAELKKSRDAAKRTLAERLNIPFSFKENVKRIIKLPVVCLLMTGGLNFALPFFSANRLTLIGSGILGTGSTITWYVYGDPVIEKVKGVAKTLLKPFNWVYETFCEIKQGVVDIKDACVEVIQEIPGAKSVIARSDWGVGGVAAWIARSWYGFSLYNTGMVALLEPAASGSKWARGALALGSFYTLYTYPGKISLEGLYESVTTFNPREAAINFWEFDDWRGTILKTMVAGGYLLHLYAKMGGKTGLSEFKQKIQHPISSVKNLLSYCGINNWFGVKPQKVRDDFKEPPAMPSVVNHLGDQSPFAALIKPFATVTDTAAQLIETARDPESSAEVIAAWCEKSGIDPKLLSGCGTALSNIEAVLNWGGKIPLVSVITGSARLAGALAISTVISAVALSMIAFGDAEKQRAGQALLREYALVHGGGNVVKGLLETTSPLLIPVTALWDLSGQRISYLGEKTSDLHLPRVAALIGARGA